MIPLGGQMTTASDIVVELKKELKSSGVTYAQLAVELKMAESSIKRMFSKSEMTLAKVNDICQVLKIDFGEIARRVASNEVLLQQLTQEQEAAVVADKQLLLVAICCMSQWTLEQIVSTYDITQASCILYLVQLDRIGIIELRPMNKYRLKLAKTFNWRPNGAVMTYFRNHALVDYFSGGFDQENEQILLVHGSISQRVAPAFTERIQKLAHDFSHQHQLDQKLSDSQKQRFTLVLGMREWELAAFTQMRRKV